MAFVATEHTQAHSKAECRREKQDAATDETASFRCILIINNSSSLQLRSLAVFMFLSLLAAAAVAELGCLHLTHRQCICRCFLHSVWSNPQGSNVFLTWKCASFDQLPNGTPNALCVKAGLEVLQNVNNGNISLVCLLKSKISECTWLLLILCDIKCEVCRVKSPTEIIRLTVSNLTGFCPNKSSNKIIKIISC